MAQRDDLLAAFARDAARCAAHEAAQKMRELKKPVVAEARALDAPADVARLLAAWAASVALGVRRVLVHEDTRAHRRDALLHECVVAMEDAVLTSYHLLRERAGGLDAPERISEAADADVARIRGAVSRVLEATTAVGAHAGAAWVEMGLLLALCWVLNGKAATVASLSSSSQAHRATELLETVITQCHAGRLARHAAWPLFAQGLIFSITQRDEPRGLECLQRAVALADQDDARFGGLCYWYAVLLSRAGQHATALEQLRVAVACNYSVVAALNLHALLAMQRGDLYEASTALERSVEIDVRGAESMFNYALLLRCMGSHDAQYQMLEYYGEATAKTNEMGESATDDGKPDKRVKKDGANRDGVEVFTDRETARLFPCSQQQVESGVVALQMAMAATANGVWHDARERFEEYFATVGSVRAVSQNARRTFIYVLLQCNRPTEALAQCELVKDEEDLWIAFYKADALLCLERVDDCEAQLKHVIEPRLASGLEANALDEELIGLHVELLNNLAVGAVCRGDVDSAVGILQECARKYSGRDDVLAVQFNLTLLLWRIDRRDAACALWFEARGWSLRMDVGDMREQQKALAFVSRVEDEALCSVGASSNTVISSHVSDTAAVSGAVDAQQLRYLDALVLNYWGNAQDSLVAKTAAQYVDYLETLSAKTIKPASTH